jgi:hypothetical protein
MANKKSQREFFTEIRDILAEMDRADLVEFIDGRLEVLANKSGKVSKKRAEEIDTVSKQVYEALVAVGKAVTVSELVKSATNEVKDYSGQRVSSYLKKLVESGKAVKTTEKKVSYFQAVAEVEDTETEAPAEADAE